MYTSHRIYDTDLTDPVQDVETVLQLPVVQPAPVDDSYPLLDYYISCVRIFFFGEMGLNTRSQLLAQHVFAQQASRGPRICCVVHPRPCRAQWSLRRN
jgi:hypothetical protein